MKRILISLSVIFISMQAYGQVHIGISSGLAATKFRNKDQGSDHSLLPGFNIGIPVLFRLNRALSFESGISYVTMGSAIKFKMNVIDAYDPIYQAMKEKEYYFRLNYLSLPVTFNVSLPIGMYSFYAKAGGYVSYALNGTIKNNHSNDKEKILMNDYNIAKLDAGIVIGTGATRTAGNGYIFIDARYMIGCSDLTTEKNYNTFLYKTYNRGLLLNVGYMFNLGNHN